LIRKGSYYYPFLPRKYFSILFDKWGEILRNNLSEIKKTVKNYEIKIGLKLYQFIRERVKGEIFCLACALKPDLHPHETLFDAAFKSKDKLILIHVLPPTSSDNDLQEVLNNLEGALKTAYELISIQPITIGLNSQGKMVQFESDINGASLKPYILTVIPSIKTEISCIGIPNDLVGEVINLDQLLGIIDEIENIEEFSDFIDYKDSLQACSSSSPFTTWLDFFGSFKDSNSILHAGALKFDAIFLDPQWGSEYRFISLSEFWKAFPEVNYFGHPRSWSINNNTLINGVLALESKRFFGYSYFLQVGLGSIFINSPFQDLTYEQGKFVDLLMGMILDSLNKYSSDITDLQFTKSMKKFHILLFPETLIKANEKFNYLTHLIPKLEKWDIDFTVLGIDEYGIRIVFNNDRMINTLNGAKDRSTQIELLIDLLMLLENFFISNNFALIQGKLIKEKTKSNRYRLFSKKKEISFPEITYYIKQGVREDKLAQKILAEIAYARKVSVGKYSGNVAKEKINSLRDDLINHINLIVEKYQFKEAIPLLIGNIDSLSCNFDRKSDQAKNSLDQEVDYQRDELVRKDEQSFIHQHNIYRYLIEKFIQLQPEDGKTLDEVGLKELLSLVDKLLHLYFISDFLHYSIYPVVVKIESDFQIIHSFDEEFYKKQESFTRQKAKIELGSIGNKEDCISFSLEVHSYMEELNLSFNKDLGFGLGNLVNVLQVLSQWTFDERGIPESTYYNSSLEEISQVCLKAIEDIDSAKISLILDFLTLDQAKVLIIEGDAKKASDLPVWEHIKRVNRYTLKPLIKIENEFFWGAYSLNQSMHNWGNIGLNHKLPADIDAPNVVKVLKKGHKAMEDSLQVKIEEIVRRFTPNIKTGVYPSKLGLSPMDIGDIDVFAYIQEENILLNIESKIIDQAYCNKDLKRIARMIFGEESESGKNESGYLQSVEQRATFLNSNSEEMIRKCWKEQSIKPRIVSIFVTKTAYWWTFDPPIKTDVNFVELRLLDDFIKGLLNEE
jgi:hypothetical protein